MLSSQVKCACVLHMNLGLASLRMDLSDEPTLGQWKIIANVGGNRQEQTFVIDEYGKISHWKIKAIPVTFLCEIIFYCDCC